MIVRGKTVYFYFVLLFVTSGCTKMSPELGFGFLKSSDESLTIEASVATINSEIANSTIQLKGLCENNTLLKILGPNNFEFKCENLSYTKNLPASLFNEGDNFISIEAYDNSKNKIATKEINIFKDTVAPVVTLAGPTTIPSNDRNISIGGTCSENSLAIQISEENSQAASSASCVNGTWNYTFLLDGSMIALKSLKFTATQSDQANNKTQTNVHTITRNLLSSFSILGVKNFYAGVYSSLLKRLTGDLIIGWTSATGALSYDVYVQRDYQNSPITVCNELDITTTSATLLLATHCALTHSENLRVKIVAWNSTKTESSIEYFNFSTKAPATIKDDAKILYINSDTDKLPPPVSISYENLIYDANSSGPFTVAIANSAGLGSSVTVDNFSATRSLIITPSTTVSGIYPVQIQITDENSITSAAITVNIAIVYPYSWTGLASSDFSFKGNWCGIAGLKTGCTGAASFPIHNNRIFIDNLCQIPKTGLPENYSPNCHSKLSATAVVRSFDMKFGSFSQNGFVFSVGTLADTSTYFKLSGGIYNSDSPTGNLNVFKSFLIEGGLFNAPRNSTLTLNTLQSNYDSDPFTVTNNTYFTHNDGTLTLVDPNGQSLNLFINVPSGFELFNFKIATTGGFWSIKSTNLIVSGNLILSGAKYGLTAPMLNTGQVNAKISLGGDLVCAGDFDGGNLPVYLTGLSAKYKSTYAGCKFPQIKVSNFSVNVAEDSASQQDSVFQSLVLTAGTFKAPENGRNLIIKTKNLDNNTLVAGLNAGGFIHNNGEIIFQTADDDKNYKISLPTLSKIQFMNAGGNTSFYDIQNNFSADIFRLAGAFAVPLRGHSKIATADLVIFDIGFVPDGSQLTSLVQRGLFSSVQVNTSSTINIPNFELQNISGFMGTSNYLDFSGTKFSLPTNNISVGLGQQLFYYSSSGSYSFGGLGSTWVGH